MRCRLVASFGLLLLSGCYSLNGYVMNSSGQAFYDQGNYSLAAAEFEKAVASTPWNPDYQANLARARFKMGDVAGAEQIYRQSLVKAPSHQPSYHGLAELMLKQNRAEEATAMLSTWTATQPYMPDAHVEMAWLQDELGQDDAAAQSLQQALQINPGHSKALAHLGQYYQERGQVNQAVAMYQQSLRSDWNQPEVHSLVAQATHAAGPNHPASQIAMARGAMPPGYAQPQMAMGAQPLMQTAWTNAPQATGPWQSAGAPGAPYVTAPPAAYGGVPYGGTPYANGLQPVPGNPMSFASQGMSAPPARFARRPEPVPDPAFHDLTSPVPTPSRPHPFSAVAQETIEAPPQNAAADDLPLIDAF